MYHFVLGGKDCRCDTADELRAICEEPKPREPTGDGAKVVATTEAIPTVEATAIPRATKRRYKRRKPQNPSAEHRIEDLPLIEGTLPWKKVKKIAKELGRTDVRQLRSDLHKRQQMG